MPGLVIHAGDDVSRLLSQDVTDAQLSESDSGCGTSNNTQTLLQTPDLVDTSIACRSSTIPLSSIHPSCVPFLYQSGSLDQTLSKRTQFLQHLSGLRRLAGPSLAVDGDGSVVWDSVLNLLSSVAEAFKEASSGRVLRQPDLLLQASEVAAQALDQSGTYQGPTVLYLDRMEETLKELLDLMLSNSQLNKVGRDKHQV